MRNNHGSNNPFYGKKHSPETREKMRLAKLGKKRGPQTEEHKRKISKANNENKKIEFVCLFCGKEFFDYQSCMRKFCSKKCHDESLIGKPSWNSGKKNVYSNDTLDKMISAKIGIVGYWANKTRPKPSIETKEKMSTAHKKRLKEKGYINSPETRLKMSLARRGENSQFWLGGKSDLVTLLRASYLYSFWRTNVYKRDNYTCQMCNSAGVELQAHHIECFTKVVSESGITTADEGYNLFLLWDINNGITLCKQCHQSIRQHEEEYKILFRFLISEKKKLTALVPITTYQLSKL